MKEWKQWTIERTKEQKNKTKAHLGNLLNYDIRMLAIPPFEHWKSDINLSSIHIATICIPPIPSVAPWDDIPSDQE